jgi:hypothetical protein
MNQTQVADERKSHFWEGQGHPDEPLLERFMRGHLSRAEVQHIIRHLLTGCPRCSRVASRFWTFTPWSRELGETPAPRHRRPRSILDM